MAPIVRMLDITQRRQVLKVVHGIVLPVKVNVVDDMPRRAWSDKKLCHNSMDAQTLSFTFDDEYRGMVTPRSPGLKNMTSLAALMAR